jgi:putative colanic acid biosynthesis acetyltransferase WcaF
LSGILDAERHNTIESGKSFDLRHRLYRMIWGIVWSLLAAWTPPPMHGWRRILLRAFGAKIAPTAGVYPSARVWYPPNLEMGDYAFLGPNVNCYCMAKITLAPYALISQGAHLCAGSHDIADPNFQLISRPITIGHRAWVAAEAFVGPGVSIGEGSVLGARGVAFKDLSAWTVYAGNPAKVVKERVLRGAAREGAAAGGPAEE